MELELEDGEDVKDYYIGSTRVIINNTYYKNRTEKEIEETIFNFSKYIYEMARELKESQTG